MQRATYAGGQCRSRRKSVQGPPGLRELRAVIAFRLVKEQMWSTGVYLKAGAHGPRSVYLKQDYVTFLRVYPKKESPKSPSPGITHFFSFKPSSTHPVMILTSGNTSCTRLSPSGDDMRLRKMMRESGTLCSCSTSMALITEPPVAVCVCVRACDDVSGEGAHVYAIARDCAHLAWGRAGAPSVLRCLVVAWRRLSAGQRE